MWRNCNIDLRLVPFSEHYCDHLHHPIMEEPSQSPSEQNKQLTIFYNGTVCVFDVTEMQAKMILCLARGVMQEKSQTPRRSWEASSTSLRSPTPMCSPFANLSMQRSLEHFLEKRKHRVQAVSPNNH